MDKFKVFNRYLGAGIQCLHGCQSDDMPEHLSFLCIFVRIILLIHELRIYDIILYISKLLACKLNFVL